VGFTPTLFARAFFDVPKMPVYLYLHGVALTAWFTLLVTQAVLADRGSLALHRKLGWAVLAFLVLIPVAGMGAQLAMPARLRELGALDAEATGFVQNIFWLNSFAMLQFLGFAIAGIRLRHRAAAHKRLMLFASAALIGPAMARFSRWPIFGNQAPDLSQPASTGGEALFAAGAVVLLVAVIIVNDLRGTRRVHPVTTIGAVLMAGMGMLAPAFANSGWGKAMVWAVSM
jgi:hypothetical protein